MKKYLFLFAIIAFGYCKKERVKSETKIPVTYTCYSKNGKFLFSYIDAANQWHHDTVYVQAHTYNIELTNAQLSYTSSVKSVTAADSLYIRGDYLGKTISNSFRSAKDIFSVSIQLSQAH